MIKFAFSTTCLNGMFDKVSKEHVSSIYDLEYVVMTNAKMCEESN